MSKLQKRLEQLARRAPDVHAFRQEALAALKEAVPFDAACCTSVDPITLLSTGAMTDDGIEAIHKELFELEYGEEDYNSHEALAYGEPHAGTLRMATGGMPELSPRYRSVLEPAGLGDELRAALTAGGACWGFIALFRTTDGQPFDPGELAAVSGLAPVIGKALRSFALSQPESVGAVSVSRSETGIMMLSPELEPLSSGGSAGDWLSALRQWERIDERTLPRPIRAVCSRALAMPPDADAGAAARVCLRIPDGSCLSLKAYRLDAMRGDGGLAVLFEPAGPADLLPLIAQAYALTDRESEIAGLILRGRSTKEIAASLHLSPYTVQDHLKSIFGKTNVNSRRELVWRLFSRFALE